MSEPRAGPSTVGVSVRIISRGLMSLLATRHWPFCSVESFMVIIHGSTITHPFYGDLSVGDI